MSEFDWDDANIEHLARHGISPEEIEYVLSGLTVALEGQDWHETEERFAEVGMTAQGRILEVITTTRGLQVRVITAWDADEDSKKKYLRSR